MNRLIVLLIAALCIGIATGTTNRPPPAALAQSCGLNTACPFGDGTVASSLTVDHAKITMVGELEVQQPVEPDTGETWQVVAKYRKTSSGTACDCATLTFTASVDVDWNGTGWTATCTSGCNAIGGPIHAVSVCTTNSCTGTSSHGWGYELMVDVDNNLFALPCASQANNARLFEVAYGTTSVDSGNLVDTGDCTLDDAVDPTSQSWTATDTGAFECTFTCESVSGPSVTIQYD